jgi:hypothetical protein
MLDNLIQNSGQGIFCCKLIYPINTMKRLVLLVPENAEAESGFVSWLRRMKYLAHQIGAPMHFLSNETSLAKLSGLFSKIKPMVPVKYSIFNDWENLDKLHDFISPDDLIVVVSARKGTLSHHIYLESIENQLVKHFSNFSHVIIYPQQYAGQDIDNSMKLDGMMVSPIQENIERISKISKKVKGVFTKKEEDNKFEDFKSE